MGMRVASQLAEKRKVQVDYHIISSNDGSERQVSPGRRGGSALRAPQISELRTFRSNY